MARRKDRYEIEDEIAVAAAPEVVMAKLLDATSWPEWQSEIVSVSGPRRVEAGDEVTGAARLAGFDVEGVSRAREVTESTFVEDVTVGVRIHVTYRVSASSEQTMLKHRLEANLPRGVLGSVLSVLLRRKLKTMQKKLLQRLADQASETSV